ncbi:MAG: alpha-mannosidase, partial [Candidatus Ratteibacteria bacterium]
AVQQQIWLRTWEFQQVNEPGDTARFDESSWKTIKDPIWATAEGTAFLRYKLVAPSEIERIPCGGSDIKIEFTFPSGITLFVDDKEVYSQQYWADMRPEPLKIIENAIPGSIHTLLLKVPKGDGHGGIYAILHIDAIEEILFELMSIRYQLAFAIAIAKSRHEKKLNNAIESALNCIKVQDIRERNWTDVLQQIKKAETVLEAFRGIAKKFTVHLIGHAHIDMNWLWNYENTKDVCVRDFASVTSLMEQFPELTFSQSQSHVYQIVEQTNPELFSKTVKRIKEKRWEVVANAWVENDLNLVHGESLVRHILYAKKYAQEKLGNLSPVMWCPDTFGHPATMPTICADAGIQYYFHMRCGKDYPLYRWKGPDGKEVLSYKAIYNNWISPERVIPSLIKFIKLLPGVPHMMFPYGVGDHGGGPTKRDYRMKVRMQGKPVMPSLVFSTAERYFRAVERYKSKLPVVKGELNTIFEGCYTTHSDIKDTNRKCEDILLTLESAMAVFLSLGGRIAVEDIRKLEQLWQKTLFNQFHDILCGSAIKSSYNYSVELGNSVIADARKMIETYVKQMPEKDGKSLMIFNPCPWERSALVNVKSEGYRIVEKIPGCGFITKNTVDIDQLSTISIKQISQYVWETDFYRIDIDESTGTIKTLYDKKNKKSVLSIAKSAIGEDPSSWWAETSSNLISIHYEQPHHMSAWIIGNIVRTENLYEMKFSKVICEPFRTIFSVKRQYKNSTITQNTILYPDFPYIDFETLIDWKELGGSQYGIPMVRTNFSFSMENPSAYYEIPFGCIEREKNGQEWPGLRWAAMKEKNYWAGIITKNRHGFNVHGNKLSITLLRNAYEPDAQSDTGMHEISYRLFFGRMNPVEITKLAAEFTLPVVAMETDARPDQNFSLFEIKGQVVPVCLKPSMDGRSMILRL